MCHEVLKDTSNFNSNNPKGSENVLDSIASRIMTNINKTTKSILNKVKPIIRKQNSVLPFGMSKDSKDRKKSKALRRAQHGTLVLSILSWVIAIITGGTAMVLDISSGIHRVIKMPITYPSSFLSCTNVYLNPLAARYTILIITVILQQFQFLRALEYYS